MRTILLTGATGQVGWELQRTLASLGQVVTPGRDVIDLARPQMLVAAIRQLRPDLIVNPAAYTAVDRAESEYELAHAINAESVAVLAREAARLKITLVHFSTDYVFDGSRSTAYTETDSPRPLGVYGQTKRNGELAIQASGADHLIFRSSWVYGLRGNNFLLTMQRLAREREAVGVVDDQVGAPTWARAIAEATSQVLGLWLSPGASADDRRQLSGIYHMSCQGQTSWHGFAQAIFAHLRARGDKVAKLAAIKTADYPLPAKRPANSILSGDRLLHTFGLSLPHWQQALKLCLSA
ncbi:MAG TPA: dTDP-4-dehydrorhamnose reductase [Thiobacillaceae bacterium]|nr:dTDP-4-dehydrorhamnose reductase [Thiobacillaceae bacterium]